MVGADGLVGWSELMGWSEGYRRIDDRFKVSHALLSERPAFALQHVASGMRAQVEHQLEGTGMNWVGFLLLSIVGRIGTASQSAVAFRACVDRTRASATLDDLEYDGYVVREQSRYDRRQLLVTLTPSGREALEAAVQAVERAEKEALPGLDVRQRARLGAMLETVATRSASAEARRAFG